MIGEAIVGLGAFKTMLDMAKGLKDLNDAAVRNAAVIDLQQTIIDAQAQQATLIERVRELEKEMARFETWETEKQRYRLTKFVPGAVAYVLKRSEARGEPGHAICASCYERRTKSILQGNGEMLLVKHAFVCPVCKAAIKTGGNDTPEFSE